MNSEKTKTCPKCGADHIKPGKFCSRACANSRIWTDEHKKVFSQKQKEYMESDDSEEHRAKRQLQVRMLLKAGIMGSSLPVERREDIMTDPDDYFLLPPRDDGDKFVEGGDVWEIDNKY
jgi:endogenous inhibitor of DNA gyrase (YacG/DUF329 family)